MLFGRRSVVTVCAMFACVVVLLAGCGGKSASTSGAATSTAAATSGSSTPTSIHNQTSSPGVSDPASKRFIAQADPICRKANVLLSHSSAKGKKAAELAAAVVVNETIERKAAAELGKLTPPPALASAWTKMLSVRRTLASGLGNLAAAVKREDQAALPALGNAKKKLHAELTKVAAGAGFTDCAKIG